MTDTPFYASYITTDAELESMIDGDKRASAIALKAASAADQEWYCQEATRHIDSIPLRGWRYEAKWTENGAQKDANKDGITQTLEFPRVIDGVVCDWDHGTNLPIVPAEVKRACVEEAIAIYHEEISGGGGRAALQAAGVQSYSIGGKLQETFRPGAGSETVRSLRARQIMQRYAGAEVR